MEGVRGKALATPEGSCEVNGLSLFSDQFLKPPLRSLARTESQTDVQVRR